jgi:hypothetical protein
VKLAKYKLPGSDQIPAELIQAGGEILLSTIHKLVNSIWNKEELPDQWMDGTWKADYTHAHSHTLKCLSLQKKPMI